jgi:hypothetical protein
MLCLSSGNTQLTSFLAVFIVYIAIFNDIDFLKLIPRSLLR